MSDAEAIAANRAAWDHSARHHRGNAEWQRLVEGFADPGFSCFDATATAALQSLGVEGKSCVQIGCNNGRECLSLKALGAGQVLGIDQSQAFLDQALDLATLSGRDVAFLCADIHALPEGLGRFDLALITIGVLNWMPDLSRFFKAVDQLIAPGGALLIYETHPFLEMFDPDAPDPFKPSISYFPDGPDVAAESITYDGSTPEEEAPVSYWFAHRLGDVIGAIAAAGLRVERLEEHAHCNREVAYEQYQNRAAQLPLCYVLTARKTV
ncbi:class I SAM-dependent methyltransferase [Nioella aestuarii]|uniref:class I SAM-dependent methyltransferase n=1 Tax=Nioella aestuarii TaxID=1662864 RepID=UPI003D7F692A